VHSDFIFIGKIAGSATQSEACNFTDVRYKYALMRGRRYNMLSKNCVAKSNKTEK